MPPERVRTGWAWGMTLLVATLILAFSLHKAGLDSVANVRSEIGLSLLLGVVLAVGLALLFRRSILEYASTGEKMPARSLRAFGFWIRYLVFCGLVGLLALGRSGGSRKGGVGR